MLEMAIASGKGGVGKSTVSATIAITLARRRKVIAVDADADAPNMHLILGLGEKWEWEQPYSESMVARIVTEKCIRCGECRAACPYRAIYVDEDGNYVVNPVICEGCETCSLVCPVKGAIVREETLSGMLRMAKTRYGFPLISARLEPGRPNSGKLVTEEKTKAKEMADDDTVIVVDSAAGIGCQVVSSLAGANMAILVAEPTPASFNALKRVHRLTKHFMQPAAVVINKWDMNPELAGEIEAYARDNNLDVLGRIPFDDSIPKSMAMMVPVTEAFPESPASKALLDVARRVEGILDDWASWFMRFRPKKPEPYRPIIIKPEGF